MSWSSLLPFAVGFFKGFVEEYTRPEPDGRMSSPHCYDFRGYMIALSEATGIHLSSLQDTSASFRFSFRGEMYIASVVSAGARTCVGVFSRIQFPRKGIPWAVVRAVKSLNRKMRNYNFEVMHVEDCSLFYIKLPVQLAALTPSDFQGLLAEMAGNMAIIDKNLSEHGDAS